MTPNSFAYIVFLVIGALIYHPLSQKAKKPFLLLLSICFYAIGGVKFLPLLALTVAFNFFAAQKLERTERKRGLLTLVLVLNLGALGLFKYLGFFGELLGCTGVQLSLPGYMIDGCGREAELHSILRCYLFFAPCLARSRPKKARSLKAPRKRDDEAAAERLIEGTVRSCSQISAFCQHCTADSAVFRSELQFAAGWIG